jgi:hypothetical protein
LRFFLLALSSEELEELFELELLEEFDELLELELLEELDELFELELLEEFDELLELELLEEFEELFELELSEELDELLELELLEELPATRVNCSVSSAFACACWSMSAGTAAMAVPALIRAAPARVVTVIVNFFIGVSCLLVLAPMRSLHKDGAGTGLFPSVFKTGMENRQRDTGRSNCSAGSAHSLEASASPHPNVESLPGSPRSLAEAASSPTMSSIVRAGCCARKTARLAVTNGTANDVPDLLARPFLPSATAISTPGAAKSTWSPRDALRKMFSFAVTAVTAIVVS